MVNRNMFDNTNILSKALDAGWMRNQVISENIANIDTPGYKRKDVEFEKHLQEALLKDHKISENKLRDLTPKVAIDKSNLSYRMDGNNVDVDTEMVELAKNQIKYNTLIDQVKNNFNRIKMVLNR